jgi:hypothetical protein
MLYGGLESFGVAEGEDLRLMLMSSGACDAAMQHDATLLAEVNEVQPHAQHHHLTLTKPCIGRQTSLRE